MFNTLDFRVPSEYIAGLASGSLERFGTIIKETSTGQIVAHIQETGASRFFEFSLQAFTAPVAAGSSIFSNFQIHQVNQKIEYLQSTVEVMKSLQFLNLGVSIIGIGVSAAGFYQMNKKFQGVQSRIEELSNYMEQKFNELHTRELRTHACTVEKLLLKSENAWHYTDPKKEWMDVRAILELEAGYYKGELISLLSQENINIQRLESLVSQFILCNTTIFKCLLLSNELPAAISLSKAFHSDLEQLFDNLTPILLAKKISLKSVDDKDYDDALKLSYNTSQGFIQNMRDCKDIVFTRELLVSTLIDKGVDGKEFIKMIETEEESPIICFPS